MNKDLLCKSCHQPESVHEHQIFCPDDLPKGQVWVHMNGPGEPHWEIRGTGAILDVPRSSASRPCITVTGVNTNICVAEGCFGYACLRSP